MVSFIGCDLVGLSGKLVQRWGWLLIGAIAATALAVFAVRWIGPLHGLETGVSDRIRIAMTSPSAVQDRRISIVTIDEATMARLPYRSPVDRGLLAQVIELLAAAGAKTVGLDILLDQPTEPEKDARLAAAIKAFPGRVVLAWADIQSGMTEQQSTWLQAFQQASGGVFGFVNLTTDPDGLVRRHSRHLPGAGMPSFAAALAGVEAPAQAGPTWAIDWRLPVADGSPPFQ
jgi:adenylate cyclase